MDDRRSPTLPQGIGWYGKLPWVGDFVGRGLPGPWVRTWDAWLQRCLPAVEQRLGRALLRQHVRGMATWQWLLPGAGRGEPAWSGVVGGSADRVGRVFPLLVAEGLDAGAIDAVPLAQLQARALAMSDWLYDAMALDSLEAFEHSASHWAATPWPPLAAAAPEPASPTGAVPLRDDTVAALRRAWPQAASFWWCTEPVADIRAPMVAAWPPHDGLMFTLLGVRP